MGISFLQRGTDRRGPGLRRSSELSIVAQPKVLRPDTSISTGLQFLKRPIREHRHPAPGPRGHHTVSSSDMLNPVTLDHVPTEQGPKKMELYDERRK